MLCDVYGVEVVLCFDMFLCGRGKFWVEQQLFIGCILFNWVWVLYGYFFWLMVSNILELLLDIFKIIWFCDLVECVVFNYFYLLECLWDIIDEEGRGVDILVKMECSFREYV